MTLAITLPNIAYVYLGFAMPSTLFAVGAAIFVENFGYGFGFSAYMLFMLYFSRGEHKTSHYALCTGFMALSMMLPGLLLVLGRCRRLRHLLCFGYGVVHLPLHCSISAEGRP